MKTKNLLIVFAVCSLLFGICNAQWIQTNGPSGGYVTCFLVNGSNLFAGTG